MDSNGEQTVSGTGVRTVSGVKSAYWNYDGDTDVVSKIGLGAAGNGIAV
jgi:hypothetical protein